MDRREMDDALREAFRRNAPPADDKHLEAALRPGTWIEPAGAGGRARKRRAARPRRRLAAVVAGAVVLAAAVGVGSWQAVVHLGNGGRVVVITDHPTSTAVPGGQTTAPALPGQTTTSATTVDLQSELHDGHWELRVDRRAVHLENVHLPSDALPESIYANIDGSMLFTVVLSAGGASITVVPDDTASVAGDALGTAGVRETVSPDKIEYNLESMAGGRFIIWRTEDGLQGEYTQYGSGVPIVASYRGRFVKVPDDDTFGAAKRGAVDAVNGLGPTRIAITQAVTVKATDSGGSLSPDELGTFVTTVEELLDPANKRGRYVVTSPDRRRSEWTVNGRDQMSVLTADLAASTKSPASRTTLGSAPKGLPVPLWAGSRDNSFDDYTYLTQIGSPWDQQVERESGGAHTFLTWRREWEGDGASGTDTVKLTLDAGFLPVRVDVTGLGTLSGTPVERTTVIEYQIQTGAVFADSEFSIDLPAYAYLESWGQQDTPADDTWGQYWLGLEMGEWSVKTGRLNILPDVSSADKESATFTYERLYPSGDDTGAYQTFTVKVTPLGARAAGSARQLGEQQVKLGNWTRTEAQVAGQPATVYAKPATGQDAGHPALLYLFLPDAFITIDLGGLVDAQQVLAAITRLVGGMSMPVETTTSLPAQ
jgi:hypothetical protein